MPTDDYVLLGVGTPYVYEVYESVLRGGGRVAAFVDNQDRAQGPPELGPIINAADLPAALLDLPVLFPLLTPGYRKTLLDQARALGFSRYPTHVDPTAIVASTAACDDGVLINAAAIVGAMSRIGRFAIVNRGASVGHHVVLEEFATLGPGCILCGSTVIGRGAFIGAGAIVNPKVNVGANAIVGSGAVVVKDVPAQSVVVGNPARVVKEGVAGYNDVAV